MKDSPYLSVVIPTLNEKKYLPLCLESFSKQTYHNFEVIVSDGGSTDQTISIAKKFGARTVVTHNSTIPLARQKGAENAKGQIIVGADADTSYPTDHLKKIAARFTANPELVAVGGCGEFEKRPWWVFWGWKIAYKIFGLFFSLFGIVIYIPAFNLSFKKDTFLKVGGYDTYLNYGGDELDILGKLKKKGKVYFDINLKAYPSSRRANVGFWKLIIVHTFIYYYLSYFLSKIFRRRVIQVKGVR